MNMPTAAWNLKTALQVEREEGREEGGDEVLELIEQGYSPDEIRKMRSEKYATEKT